MAEPTEPVSFEEFEPPVPEVVIPQATRHDARVRFGLGVGACLLAAAAAGAALEAGQGHDGNITHHMPFVATAQRVAENVTPSLEDLGLFVFPAALAGIGAVELAARRNRRLAQIDTLSSTDITDGSHHLKSRVGRAATVSLIVTTGAGALGGFVGSLSSEISNGPNRPIVAMLGNMAPGAQSMIVENAQAEPMVESSLNPQLVKKVEQVAATDGISATPFDMHLGSYKTKTTSGTDLTIAVKTVKASPLALGAGCSDIPVLIDTAANVPTGAHIAVDGVPATVEGHITNASATNRITVVTSEQALKECIEQDPNAPDYGILLNANEAQARQILAAANRLLDAPAAAIPTEQFIGNSEDFWKNNVEALVGILAMVALGVSGVSMSGATRQRLLQDRKYWGQNLSQGVSENTIRAVELLRAAKVGAKAAVISAPVSLGLTLLGADTVMPGFGAGVGLREAALGAAVTTIGSVGGAAVQLIHPSKTINVREETRV